MGWPRPGKCLEPSREEGFAAGKERAQIRAVTGAQFGHLSVFRACDPDAIAVGGEAIGLRPDGETLDSIGSIELLGGNRLG